MQKAKVYPPWLSLFVAAAVSQHFFVTFPESGNLDWHEFEYAPGVGDGQGSLACCSSWGCKESDTTE